MRTHHLAPAAALLVASLGLTACGAPDATASDDVIKIGIKFDQPGLGQKVGGEYQGLDVDVATYIAAELGYTEDQIEWVQAPSSQRETLLQTGQVRLVVATYSITDERREKVSFAGPYFVAHQDLLVRAEDADVVDVESLSGRKLCSVAGGTSAQTVREMVPGVQLQEFETYAECLPALA